jgi:hypothetical protein
MGYFNGRDPARFQQMGVTKYRPNQDSKSDTLNRDGHNMDLDHTHARLMAALKGIVAGKSVGDTIAVQPYGTSTTIFTALNDAAKYLNEPFADDDLGLVDQATKKIGLTRASNQKNAVGLAILGALTPPKAIRNG